MTVIPVVDYEPRTLPGGPEAQVRPPAARRTRHLHAVAAAAPPSPRFRRATAFADAALRSVLEVIDRRRPLSQLRPILVPGLIDSVEALLNDRALTEPAPRRGDGGAALHRVHVQAADPDERAFEVSAVYRRGPRLRAVAGRVECADTAQGAQWLLVALHLG